MRRLKVLVFDDSRMHRLSAKLTLGKDHDLKVVGTYDEAQDALKPTVDNKRWEQIFAQKFGDCDPYRSTGITQEQRALRLEYYWATEKDAIIYPDFDVVLTDLLVPASGRAQADGRFVGTKMPLGAIIALLALAGGVKKVAVVTDMNHHNHPASAAFDCFYLLNKWGTDKNIICTNKVLKVLIDETTGELVDPHFIQDDQGQNTEEGLKKYPFPKGETLGKRIGLSEGKNWHSVLDNLLRE